MDAQLTVQQAAEATGLSAHTLRYYERIGLVQPVGRAASGHRRYTQQDLAWIGFLNCLRATGMPIARMQEYAALLREGESTLAERTALLQAHQAAVQAEIASLQTHLGAVEAKLRLYEQRRLQAAGK
ncbi:MAG TPA: MerR family transcriptional regulator [Longimicrobium sp.]|jgi:DNA-binding transcriptional MerR regulator|uniref:MerR family transcriptional regulator n=1 Tax=Longimicrobium sp. TaxID=2029185 RepID=UPI002ED78490